MVWTVREVMKGVGKVERAEVMEVGTAVVEMVRDAEVATTAVGKGEVAKAAVMEAAAFEVVMKGGEVKGGSLTRRV